MSRNDGSDTSTQTQNTQPETTTTKATAQEKYTAIIRIDKTHILRERERERERGGGMEGGREGRGGGRGRDNSNSKTLFYKDCSLGSVKQLVLARLLMNRYQITGIIYKHIGMNE